MQFWTNNATTTKLVTHLPKGVVSKQLNSCMQHKTVIRHPHQKNWRSDGEGRGGRGGPDVSVDTGEWAAETTEAATCVSGSLTHVTSRFCSTSSPSHVLHSFAYFWGPNVPFVTTTSYMFHSQMILTSADASIVFCKGTNKRQKQQEFTQNVDGTPVRITQTMLNDQCMLFTLITKVTPNYIFTTVPKISVQRSNFT